jgi:hypothetical protein
MTMSAFDASVLATPTLPAVSRWERREDSSGYLYVTPSAADIARASGLDVETLSLAALIASEVGTLSPRYYAIVGEVGLAEARARGTTVTKLLTSAVKSGHAGEYGEQTGRYAASSVRPNRRHYRAAELIRRGDTADFSRGARKFFAPKVMDAGKQRGRTLAHDAESLYRKWYGEGWRWTGHGESDGIDPYVLFPMARTGASFEAGLAAIADGRRRNKVGGGAGMAGLVLVVVVALGAALYRFA